VTDVAADRAGSPGADVAGARLLHLLRSPRRVLALTVPLLPLALALVWPSLRGVAIDLEVYRFGVQALLHGGDIYGPLPVTAIGISLGFLYPPFAALVLAPFALVPWPVAYVGLLVSSVVAIAVTLHVTARRLWPSAGRGAAVAVASVALPLSFALEPVRWNFVYGQINLLLMVLVAVDCLVARPRWPRGVLVGIAAAIKLTPAAFVLFFLLRGDRRAAATAAVSGAVATLLAFVVLPQTSLRFWLHNPAGGVSGAPFFTNQTLLVVLVRAGVDPPLRTVVWVLLCVGLLALAVPTIRRAPAPLAMVATGGVALLVSPTSWSHHWTWVVPGMLVVTVTAWRLRSRGWAATAVAMAFVYVAAPHTWGLPRDHGLELTWSGVEQFVGSTYVWFTVLLYVAHLRWLRARRRPTDPLRSGRSERPAAGAVTP